MVTINFNPPNTQIKDILVCKLNLCIEKQKYNILLFTYSKKIFIMNISCFLQALEIKLLLIPPMDSSDRKNDCDCLHNAIYLETRKLNFILSKRWGIGAIASKVCWPFLDIVRLPQACLEGCLCADLFILNADKQWLSTKTSLAFWSLSTSPE